MLEGYRKGYAVMTPDFEGIGFEDESLEKCKEYVRMRNPKAQVIPICAKTGEGVDVFANWLLEQVKNWKQQ